MCDEVDLEVGSAQECGVSGTTCKIEWPGVRAVADKCARGEWWRVGEWDMPMVRGCASHRQVPRGFAEVLWQPTLRRNHVGCTGSSMHCSTQGY